MQYAELRYIPEEQDPSVTIETSHVIARVIDNTGLLAPDASRASHRLISITHFLGYHGIRTLYNRREKRNLVVPLASWLNLQQVELAGIAPDPVDERAWAGKGRGWPLRLEPKGRGAILRLDPQPSMQMSYTLELQPAEPDGLDFAVRFRFGRAPESGPKRFHATWPCYTNTYDDVRLFYPQRTAGGEWRWASIGERPDVVLGEPVGYDHTQKRYVVDDPALPLGYGRIGENVLIFMFSDPRVELYLVDAGAYRNLSSVPGPAWDFKWAIDDYPLGQWVGFQGRIIYTRFEGQDQVLARFQDWSAAIAPTMTARPVGAPAAADHRGAERRG